MNGSAFVQDVADGIVRVPSSPEADTHLCDSQFNAKRKCDERKVLGLGNLAVDKSVDVIRYHDVFRSPISRSDAAARKISVYIPRQMALVAGLPYLAREPSTRAYTAV